MLALLAEVILFQGGARTWGIGEIAILIVAVAAIVALVVIALRKFQITIPDWVQQVFWVLVIAFVIIMAIRFVMSM